MRNHTVCTQRKAAGNGFGNSAKVSEEKGLSCLTGKASSVCLTSRPSVPSPISCLGTELILSPSLLRTQPPCSRYSLSCASLFPTTQRMLLAESAFWDTISDSTYLNPAILLWLIHVSFPVAHKAHEDLLIHRALYAGAPLKAVIHRCLFIQYPSDPGLLYTLGTHQ